MTQDEIVSKEGNITEVIRAFLNSIKLLKLKYTLDRKLMQSYLIN